MVNLIHGDVVKVIGSDDILIRKGSYGIVSGKWGNRVEVTFNFYAPIVSGRGFDVSGGPVRLISRNKIKHTSEKKMIVFRRWTAGGWIRHKGGNTFAKKVDVWKVDLRSKK